MNVPVQRRFFIIPDENTWTLSIISGFYHADLAILAGLVVKLCILGIGSDNNISDVLLRW